ncbi:BSD domain-containing protein [Heracleum sosnowskyi]|uniref:BSD domain-containing protein n=1 Tax=Heracleum sosnowskyi TaxID=360622 RepID=A0AAD8GXC7_9APIA|nr:BSD domain-containing protein [Heracleum sosnowskyi]
MENMYSWVRKSLSRPIKIQSFSKNKTTHQSILQENQEIYGVNDKLIDLISSFTLDTFRNYPLQDEEGGANGGDGDGDGDDDSKAFGSVRNDLSEWQQQHAILVLSRVKELSQLRFKLCPRYLKERDFWRIYFTLAKNNLAEYELRAKQNLLPRKFCLPGTEVDDPFILRWLDITCALTRAKNLELGICKCY